MVDPLLHTAGSLAQGTPCTTTAITAGRFVLTKLHLETPKMTLKTCKHLSSLNSLILFENRRVPLKHFRCAPWNRTMQNHRWLWTALPWRVNFKALNV